MLLYIWYNFQALRQDLPLSSRPLPHMATLLLMSLMPYEFILLCVFQSIEVSLITWGYVRFKILCFNLHLHGFLDPTVGFMRSSLSYKKKWVLVVDLSNFHVIGGSDLQPAPPALLTEPSFLLSMRLKETDFYTMHCHCIDWI